MDYDDYYNHNFTQPWEWEDSESYREWMTENVLNGSAVALGLLANGLLLGLLSRTSLLRTVSNMYLLQRAVADVLVLMVVPFVIHANIYYHYHDEFSKPLCTALTMAMHGATMASHVFLMLFTVDSYLASRPQRHTLARRRKVLRVTSAAAWLLAAVYGVTIYFNYSGDRSVHCYLREATHLFMTHNLVFRLGMPLVVVWVFVVMALCQGTANPGTQPVPEEGERAPSLQLQLGLAATFTVIRFLFLFLAYKSLSVHSGIPIIAYTLPNLEKVVNPILVICLLEGLRKTVARGWLPVHRSASLPLQEL